MFRLVLATVGTLGFTAITNVNAATYCDPATVAAANPDFKSCEISNVFKRYICERVDRPGGTPCPNTWANTVGEKGDGSLLRRCQLPLFDLTGEDTDAICARADSNLCPSGHEITGSGFARSCTPVASADDGAAAGSSGPSGQVSTWEECARLKTEYDKDQWFVDGGDSRLKEDGEDGQACCLDNPADDCLKWSQEYQRLSCCSGVKCNKVSCEDGYEVVGDECAQSCRAVECQRFESDDAALGHKAGDVDWGKMADMGAIRAACVKEDMGDCTTWFDGCNECTRHANADGLPSCTKKYCSVYQEPKCLDPSYKFITSGKCEDDSDWRQATKKECEAGFDDMSFARTIHNSYGRPGCVKRSNGEVIFNAWTTGNTDYDCNRMWAGCFCVPN